MRWRRGRPRALMFLFRTSEVSGGRGRLPQFYSKHSKQFYSKTNTISSSCFRSDCAFLLSFRFSPVSFCSRLGLDRVQRVYSGVIVCSFVCFFSSVYVSYFNLVWQQIARAGDWTRSCLWWVFKSFTRIDIVSHVDSFSKLDIFILFWLPVLGSMCLSLEFSFHWFIIFCHSCMSRSMFV